MPQAATASCERLSMSSVIPRGTPRDKVRLKSSPRSISSSAVSGLRRADRVAGQDDMRGEAPAPLRSALDPPHPADGKGKIMASQARSPDPGELHRATEARFRPIEMPAQVELHQAEGAMRPLDRSSATARSAAVSPRTRASVGATMS
jgi:hypothetical protein